MSIVQQLDLLRERMEGQLRYIERKSVETDNELIHRRVVEAKLDIAVVTAAADLLRRQ